jgi:GNAT superfamily N-acetyltransferase
MNSKGIYVKMQNPSSIRVRIADDKDEPFLETVFRSTREEELRAMPWPPLQKDAFILMQFIAQQAQYKKDFPGVVFHIIEYRKKAAGRLYIAETLTDIRIMDISLLPGFRGMGIGGQIIRDLQKKARSSYKTISLNVKQDNRALGLYVRLGFAIKARIDRGYLFMEWTPEDIKGN